MSICETRKNKKMLISPVIWAISDVLHIKPEWLGDPWFGPPQPNRYPRAGPCLGVITAFRVATTKPEKVFSPAIFFWNRRAAKPAAKSTSWDSQNDQNALIAGLF